MSRLRITRIEIEDGSEEVYRAALAEGGGASVPVVAPAAAVPVGPVSSFGPVSTPSAETASAPDDPDPEPRSQRRGRKPGQRGPGRRKKAVGSSPTPGPAAPEPSEGTNGARILEVLKKKPMSSGELIAHLACPPQSVYVPCSALKAKGAIVNRLDESAGVKRWYLAK